MIAIATAPTATDVAHAPQIHVATETIIPEIAATDRATAGTMIGETGGTMADVSVVMTDAIDLETVVAHGRLEKAGIGNTGTRGMMNATARATGL